MPNTSNIGLQIPVTGSQVGTWGDLSINPDMVALDGLLGGVVTIGLSSSNVTLTAPAGSISATAGPVQSQNAVLRFTGTLLNSVLITLPLPGYYIIENLTLGAFVVRFRANPAGTIISTPQGSRRHIYNDGTNTYLVNGPDPGTLEFLSGVSAMPLWVTLSTVPPKLLCDGTVYNIADYPYLGAIYGSTFGGNGFTTFGVPDLRGRVPLPYDGAANRITTAGCGINGDTLGAAGGSETHILTTAQLAAHTHAKTLTITDPGHFHNIIGGGTSGSTAPTVAAIPPGSNTAQTQTKTTGITAALTISNAGGNDPHNNVQPSLVTGIWVVNT